MARTFLDIGAHLGETLTVAREARWGFDRICCFEPAPACWPALEALADERVEILRFGLWTADATAELHDPGSIGASMFASKGDGGATATIEVRDAAAWWRANIGPDDLVVMKVNCEGAECDLLEHLLDAGLLDRVDELLVHFDVRKIPGMEHREAETRARLDAAGVAYRPAERIMFGRDTPEKTANWLAWYAASGPARLRYSVLRRVEFALRVPVYRVRRRLGLTD